MLYKQSQKILGEKHKPFRYNGLLIRDHILRKIVAARNKRINIPKISQKLNRISIEAITEIQK